MESSQLRGTAKKGERAGSLNVGNDSHRRGVHLSLHFTVEQGIMVLHRSKWCQSIIECVFCVELGLNQARRLRVFTTHPLRIATLVHILKNPNQEQAAALELLVKRANSPTRKQGEGGRGSQGGDVSDYDIERAMMQALKPLKNMANFDKLVSITNDYNQNPGPFCRHVRVPEIAQAISRMGYSRHHRRCQWPDHPPLRLQRRREGGHWAPLERWSTRKPLGRSWTNSRAFDA